MQQSPARWLPARLLFLLLFIHAASGTSVSWALTPEPGGDTVRLSRISQHGITWKLSHQVDVGRFINGDYYVVGPVTVVEITPAFSKGRNGSMLNPDFGVEQGYDSREGETYRSQRVAKPPINLNPGDVLVSTRSRTGSQRRRHVMADSLPDTEGLSYALLTSAAILTCVDAPKPGRFRPPYSGPRRYFRESALRWDRLPRLTIAGTLPDVSYWERIFERPWIDHLSRVWINRYIHPTDNMPDYGREMSLAVSMASLILASDISTTEKRSLLISFVQFGIDTWGLATQADADEGWESMGGHGNGRKWPMIFAGLLLDEQEILQTRALFSEDQQTSYGQGWNGASALYRWYHRSYPSSAWHYEETRPRDWSTILGEEYRRCCTSVSWPGTALVALAMGARQAWGHDAYFDYVDRWMEEPDGGDRAELRRQLGSRFVSYWDYYGQAGSGDGGWRGTTVYRYPWDMWQRHRSTVESSVIFVSGFENGFGDWIESTP